MAPRAEWTFEGGPERRNDSISFQYGLTVSATVTYAAYMSVYEEWTFSQFEWHRG